MAEQEKVCTVCEEVYTGHHASKSCDKCKSSVKDDDGRMSQDQFERELESAKVQIRIDAKKEAREAVRKEYLEKDVQGLMNSYIKIVKEIKSI